METIFPAIAIAMQPFMKCPHVTGSETKGL